MSASEDFVYAQARLQARHGERLREADWRLVEATADVAGYLHAARTTSLQRWVARLDPHAPAHLIERTLRAEWRTRVAEVASWQPGRWRPAVEWLRHLIDLPALALLLQGGTPPAWWHDDPLYGGWARALFTGGPGGIAHSALAALATGESRGIGPLEAWAALWRRRWPRGSALHVAGLEELAESVRRHRMAMRTAPADGGQALRAGLAARASWIFRRNPESPAAGIAHLLLDALELERLRAGLVQRALRAAIGAAEV